MTKSLLALAAVLVFLAAPVGAHVTVTVDPLTAPLVVGVPTEVTVRFSEPCFEMPIEAASGNDQLTAALAPGAPAYVTGAGETVPWSMDGCEPSTAPTDFGGKVRQAAILAIVVDASAPGLSNLTIPVTYVNANGESTEGVPLNVTVAYHANGTLAASEATGHGHEPANATSHAITLALTYVTNAESVLTVEATTTSGEVAAISSVLVTPPSFDNKTSAVANLTATFTPPAQWTESTLTFKAYLTPRASDAKVPVGTATLMLANDAEDGAHTEHEHEDAEASPAPAFAFIALGLLAFASFRRR